MKIILMTILLSVSQFSIADIYSSQEDIITQQLKNELEQKQQRELKKQTADIEYAEQQRYLRQSEQDARIRQQEEDRLEKEQEKRHWPQPFDVKRGYY